MDSRRRDFMKKSFGFMGVAATTVALSKIGFSEAQALEIGDTSKSTQNPMDVSGTCSYGSSCGGGGGSCSYGSSCGGGGGSGMCSYGSSCGGGGGSGTCSYGSSCSGY